MKVLKLLGLAAVAGTLASPAQASLMAYICTNAACTGAGNLTATDNGANDLDPTLGSIILRGAVNGFRSEVNISQSKPSIGGPYAPELDLNYTATSPNSILRTAYFYVTDTDFLASSSYRLLVNGNQSAATPSGSGGTFSGRAFGGNSNLPRDTSHTIASLGPTSAAAINLSSFGPFHSTITPYSLTLQAVVTRNAAGTTTGDYNFAVAIMEPSSVALLAAGLVGLVLFVRRRPNGDLSAA